MSTTAEMLELMRNDTPKAGSCRFAKWLATVDDEAVHQAVNQALDKDSGITGMAILRFVRSKGCQSSESAINDHRCFRCACLGMK